MSNIIFIKLFVHDRNAMAAFYKKVLSLKETGRTRYAIERGLNKGIEVEEITLSPLAGANGSPTFILLQYLDNRPAANAEVTIGFMANDLAGVIERTNANGGAVMHGPEAFEAPGADGKMISGELIVIADPEGHLTEIAQVMSS